MELKQSNINPSLHETMRASIERVLIGMYFCLPAKIVSYDPETQYADLQIQLLLQLSDDSTAPFPVLPNVPVKHLRARGGAAFIHMPLEAGDDMLLVFSQRSLDNWKTQGGMTNPDDNRKFDLTDAFALIGGSAIPDAFTPQTTDAIEIVNGEAAIQIFPDGHFKITNGVSELISLTQQLAQQCAEMTTNTIFGPMPPNNFAEFVDIALELESLVGE